MSSTSLASGPTIERLGHFRRADPGDDSVAKTLREHAGKFFVAFGLALQGLRGAAVDTSLIPQKSGVLARLAALPFLTRAATSAWGIDLGGYAIKAVQLRKDASGRLKIEGCQHIVLRQPLAHPDAPSQRLGILADALADLASRASLQRSRIVAGLSGQRVLGRVFRLPPLPEKKMSSAVQYEACRQLPLDLNELCWDWQELDEPDDEPRQPSGRRILVVAARRTHVEQRLSLFRSAGIAVDVMQSNCLALHNAVQWEFAGQPPDEATALVDIGSDETNFVVSAPRSVWFRTFTPGGHAFTAALAQHFRLTYDQAELLKRHPERSRDEPRFRTTIEPLLVQLAREIERSLTGCRRQSSTPQVQRLFVLGGGAHLHGLLRHLRPW